SPSPSTARRPEGLRQRTWAGCPRASGCRPGTTRAWWRSGSGSEAALPNERTRAIYRESRPWALLAGTHMTLPGAVTNGPRGLAWRLRAGPSRPRPMAFTLFVERASRGSCTSARVRVHDRLRAHVPKMKQPDHAQGSIFARAAPPGVLLGT